MANASDMRALAVEYMVSREKMNSYTQGSRRNYFFGYPDNIPGNKTQAGHSDCSSAVRKAILAAAGIDIGSNTNAQINNRSTKGQIVHTTDGYLPDEDALLPGDCLYFKGNPGHSLDVGHVEMYIGGGRICGHGSGKGPRIRSMKDYCASRNSASRRYFMAIRWIRDEEKTDIPADRRVEIAPGKWHVRKGPGSDYASAGTVSGGSVLQRIDAGEWIPILWNGEVRFIGPRAAKG